MPTPIHFKFNEIKAAQTTAHLLEKSGGKLSYMLALKILYAIDRTALANWGQPIIGGSYCSMKNGPLTSEIYDRVKAGRYPEAQSYWGIYLSTKDKDLKLKKRPGTDELSEAELQLIDDVYAMLGHRDKWDVVDMTHIEFKEWENPGKSSKPIPVEKMLKALDKSSEEIHRIAKETSYYQSIDALLSR